MKTKLPALLGKGLLLAAMINLAACVAPPPRRVVAPAPGPAPRVVKPAPGPVIRPAPARVVAPVPAPRRWFR